MPKPFATGGARSGRGGSAPERTGFAGARLRESGVNIDP